MEGEKLRGVHESQIGMFVSSFSLFCQELNCGGYDTKVQHCNFDVTGQYLATIVSFYPFRQDAFILDGSTHAVAMCTEHLRLFHQLATSKPVFQHSIGFEGRCASKPAYDLGAPFERSGHLFDVGH